MTLPPGTFTRWSGWQFNTSASGLHRHLADLVAVYCVITLAAAVSIVTFHASDGSTSGSPRPLAHQSGGVSNLACHALFRNALCYHAQSWYYRTDVHPSAKVSAHMSPSCGQLQGYVNIMSVAFAKSPAYWFPEWDVPSNHPISISAHSAIFG